MRTIRVETTRITMTTAERKTTATMTDRETAPGIFMNTRPSIILFLSVTNTRNSSSLKNKDSHFVFNFKIEKPKLNHFQLSNVLTQSINFKIVSNVKSKSAHLRSDEKGRPSRQEN